MLARRGKQGTDIVDAENSLFSGIESEASNALLLRLVL